jgi:non-specific serine/threonine protein kinase/serine/threonine-protein kinase
VREDDWQRQWDLFHAARDRLPAERAQFLDRECMGDPSLRARIDALLHADAAARDIFPDVGDSVRPRRDAEPPTQVGPFRLLRKIGEGGFAEVWLAEQKAPVAREVAVKLLKPGMDSRRIVARFDAERDVLARLQHPGIARVLDAGLTDTGHPWFAMEYVDGHPITQYCDEHSLSPDARIDLFLGVCAAVQHAQERGIIHRDLKPSNVLVTTVDGQPLAKVIDFGIAKAIQTDEIGATWLTEAGQLLGTPGYMSPEQLQAEEIDTRSDVYALGVLLYELLVGVQPVDTASVQRAGVVAMVRLLCESNIPRPSTKVVDRSAVTESMLARRRIDRDRLRRRLRGDLDWIIARALDRERERRYRSPIALAEDLSRHRRHQPVEAGPPSLRYRVGKWIQRNRATSFALAAIVVSLALGAVWLMRIARAERVLRLETESAAKTSRAVIEFLTRDVLSAADPRQAERPDMTVREALDRAAATIDRRFEAEPASRAAVHAALGNTFGSLGALERALHHLERAADESQRIHGDESLLTESARNDLAIVYRRMGRYADAERILRAMLVVREQRLGSTHRETVATRLNLGSILAQAGRLAEAEPLIRSAVGDFAEVLGDDHGDTMLARQHHASALLNLDRKSEAEPLIARVLAHQIATRGADHPYTIAARSSLAKLREDLGNVDDAEAEYREVVASCERRVGDGHADTHVARVNLGALLVRRGRYEAAETILRSARDRLDTLLPPTHPNLAFAIHSLARLEFGRNSLEHAEPLFADAAERMNNASNARDARRAEFILDHARCLVKLGHRDPAIERLRAGLAVCDDLGTPARRVRLAILDELIALGDDVERWRLERARAAR